MLLDLIYRRRCSVVAIIGVAKNTGKTTTLNAIINAAAADHIKLGITSVGRDGERVDLVTGLQKPLIWVPKETLFVTAEEALTRCCTHQVLRELPLRTAMGNLMLCKTLTAGEVEVAGADTRRDNKVVVRILQAAGVDLVLLDGSTNRIFSCAPSLAQGTILATGAAFSSSLTKVVQQTAHLISLFGLPSPSPAISARAMQIVQQKQVAILKRDGKEVIIDIPTLLMRSDEIALQMSGNKGDILVTGGAVTDRLVKALTSKTSAPRIIATDMTHIFITPLTARALKRAGGSIEVLRRATLLAVTINPWSPWGRGFPAAKFLAAVKEVSPVPVLNLKRGSDE
ncbi:hypothetical protein LM597_00495 [Candidatus Acetothermia bacterium]|nr:hypothetical protein [Candidatus Acetothermia bacterium]